ncbi:MAG: hypothetical protein BWY63_02457 [Chloroflexi bacterium ADurb.Bin360]|nr:MAG: hypothetical protein BWY63_02457 [Chloroflexi bacterium ADurb.Bin360]
MQIIQRNRQAARDLQREADIQTLLLLEQISQRSARQILHHRKPRTARQVGLSHIGQVVQALLLNRKQAHNAGMFQPAQPVNLVFQGLAIELAVFQLLAYDFQHHQIGRFARSGIANRRQIYVGHGALPPS